MKQLARLLGIFLSSNALFAGEVEIPLLAETAQLHALVGGVLELDESGQNTLGNDQCNRLGLSDLGVVPEGGQLAVSMAGPTGIATDAPGGGVGPGGRVCAGFDRAITTGREPRPFKCAGSTTCRCAGTAAHERGSH